MISIIMPCYNVEEFVRHTIESVMAQSFTDWELIVVNDGSTDGTSAICSYFAGRDSRIKYISQSNRGVAVARNEGLAVASGDYVAFLDSDDIWPRYNLEYLMNLIREYDGDIAAGRMATFVSDTQLEGMLRREGESAAPLMTEVNVLGGMEATECSLYQRGVIPSLWAKLFKRSLFDGIEFVRGELYEDLNVFHELTLRTHRYVRGGATVYYYRSNPRSLLHTFNERRLVVLDVTRRIEYYMRENHPELEAAAVDRRFAANMNMLGLLLLHRGKAGIKDYDKRLDECRAYIRETRGEVARNRKSRMKNRCGALLNMILPRFLFERVLRGHYS